jgi:uncharacterized membrane protein
MYSLQNETFNEPNALPCQCYRNQSMKEENNLRKKTSFIFPVLGWISFAISLLFLPILFGGLALFMSIMTFFERSQVHGAILMVFSATGLILGTLFNIFVTGTMFF